MCSYLAFPTVPFPPHRLGGDAEPGLLQVPPMQLMVLENFQPFPNFHLLLVPIPNDTMELGPRLSQGITNWMLAFQGFLQQSWLCFCIWLQCVCFCQRSQQCPGAKAVQAGLQSSCSHKVFVSHFSCLSRRKTNVGHYGWKQSPRTEVWG